MRFNKFLKWSLVATGVMNMLGAALFAPFVGWLREAYSFPATHPLYLWIISAWIFFFGLCYLWLGIKGGRERLFLAIGAAGKASFVVVMFAYALLGQIPLMAALGSLADLVFAIIFVIAILRGDDAT